MYTFVHMCVYMCAYTYKHVCACMYVYTHIHVHMHTHTHIAGKLYNVPSDPHWFSYPVLLILSPCKWAGLWSHF